MTTQTIDLNKVSNDAQINVVNGAVEIEGITILGAGEAHAGAIGGHTVCVDVIPTLTVHSGYTTGDYIGTSSVPMTFSGCSRINNGTGMILGAVLVDYALQSVPGELWLFDTSPTPPVDSAAWTIADSDAARCIGVIPLSTYYASALNSVCPVGNLTIAFQTLSNSKNIYGCFVTRGSPSYASGDLVFRLRTLQD